MVMDMEVYAHLHNLGLFLEIRMKVVIALMHPLMLAKYDGGKGNVGGTVRDRST